LIVGITLILNKIKCKFYSSAEFTIGCSGTGKFKVKPIKENFRDYTYYKLNFYGMARRGSTWKGNRLIREDKK
jgi:hypothetical protein